MLPLLEKRVIIDRLAANGLRFGTPRATDDVCPWIRAGAFGTCDA